MIDGQSEFFLKVPTNFFFYPYDESDGRIRLIIDSSPLTEIIMSLLSVTGHIELGLN